jgi:hypothetical protein
MAERPIVLLPGFRPQMHIFTSDAQPWDQMDPALPKYDKYPPAA